MVTVLTTQAFDVWFAALADKQAKVRIQVRIDRLEHGNVGDWKPVGAGVSELRIDHGPGYRLYYTMRENVIVILLCGSAKRDQAKAIRLAKAMAKEV